MSNELLQCDWAAIQIKPNPNVSAHYREKMKRTDSATGSWRVITLLSKRGGENLTGTGRNVRKNVDVTQNAARQGQDRESTRRRRKSVKGGTGGDWRPRSDSPDSWMLHAITLGPLRNLCQWDSDICHPISLQVCKALFLKMSLLTGISLRNDHEHHADKLQTQQNLFSNDQLSCSNTVPRQSWIGVSKVS